MTKQTDGGPAFAAVGVGHGDVYEQRGMSLRDWFAGMAIMGSAKNESGTAYREMITDSAYAIADAMLAARDLTQGE